MKTPKPLLAFVAAITGLAIFSTHAQSTGKAQSGGKHHIVFEATMDGAQQWTGTLNNVANAQQVFGKENTEIEVVAHSNGLGLVLKTNDALKERMQELAGSGVVFAAYQNTMKKKNVSKDDLLPFVTIVDSGVAEVVRKQESGWAYLKSGN
jgi:intracellular sulfur oxidation DsrE/DsrF family protein